MPLPSSRQVADIRQRIDSVDQRFIALLAERATLVRELVEVKRANQIAVKDPGREQAILAEIELMADANGLDRRVAHKVMRAVIDAFTDMQLEALHADDPGEAQ